MLEEHSTTETVPTLFLLLSTLPPFLSTKDCFLEIFSLEMEWIFFSPKYKLGINMLIFKLIKF